jgi:hypothetical protein
MDHIVLFNNHSTTTTTTTTTGLNMLPVNSITKSRGFFPSESVWVETTRNNTEKNNLVWGRIKDNGVNYIVEGYKGHGLQWVRIPCKRLQDAQLILSSVMNKKDFAMHRELKDLTYTGQ